MNRQACPSELIKGRVTGRKCLYRVNMEHTYVWERMGAGSRTEMNEVGSRTSRLSP